MSPDEQFVTIAATVLGLGGWIWSGFRFTRVRRLRPGPGVGALAVAVLACAGIIAAVLLTAASADVRTDPRYLFMYLMLGLAWVQLAAATFRLFGISARDDVIERRNDAALYAVCGALAGVTLCYAGGNIGDGPGWWVVVFAAGIATLAFCLTWGLHELLTGSSEAITIDRDPAAGIRLGAFLVAGGLLFGRGVAGDWVSVDLTLADFSVVLPAAVVLLALSWVIERATKPTAERPRAPFVSHGLGAGLLYVGLAVAYIVSTGSPS